MKYLILYIASFASGGVGAWSIAKHGSILGLLDRSNDRSSHEGVVPKGGGIGILAAFVLSSLVLKIPASFWLPATFLALFSFFGDKVELSPKVRLPVQFIAALALLSTIDSSSIFCLLSSDLCPPTSALWILFLSVFIVGTANFYNFMDGINGISGVTGVVAFALLAFFASLSGTGFSFVTLAICISLSCLGFLPFNMPRAKVFMGDVGSILLGFVFAAMVVWLSKSLLDIICLAAFLFPFYADELTTMAVRIKDGENVLRPHRRHLYQLLANEKGISHWKISVGYGLLQLVIGVSVLAIKPLGIVAVLFLLGAYFGGFTLVSYNIRLKVNSLYDR
jgi:Fuc2NAc and GlcNAc transferase